MDVEILNQSRFYSFYSFCTLFFNTRSSFTADRFIKTSIIATLVCGSYDRSKVRILKPYYVTNGCKGLNNYFLVQNKNTT